MRTWDGCLAEESWAWQYDANVVAVMAYLLKSAADGPRRYGYEMLARGDAIVSHGTLAEATGLTERQVRLVLLKLKSVEEIEATRIPRGWRIHLLRYEEWHSVRRSDDAPNSLSGQVKQSAPVRIPQIDCRYCQGSGNICGELCACIGGQHKSFEEIASLRKARDEAMQKIHEQLAMPTDDGDMDRG